MFMGDFYKAKRVLVTGAGKGIGKAVVIKLHECGCTVFALSRSPEPLLELKESFPNISILPVDLKDWDKTRETVESIGQLDAVFNIAGIGAEEPFLEITSKCFDDIINSNLKSVVAVSQVAAKNMIKSNTKGTIVNISSRMARRAFLDCSIYSASKAALDMLTKSMALELGPYGIRVNSINLGPVWTPMWADTFTEGGVGRSDGNAFIQKTLARMPLGKAFVPMEDVVSTLLFLGSDATSMLTGENIALDGGYCTG